MPRSEREIVPRQRVEHALHWGGSVQVAHGGSELSLVIRARDGHSIGGVMLTPAEARDIARDLKRQATRGFREGETMPGDTGENQTVALPDLSVRHEPFAVSDETAALVCDVLARVTYKPGWTFTATRWGDGLYIESAHSEVDSRDGHDLPGFQRRIPIRWPTYTATTVEAVLAWVRHCVHEWETHEADEWLRVDGAHVHDPTCSYRVAIGVLP